MESVIVQQIGGGMFVPLCFKRYRMGIIPEICLIYGTVGGFVRGDVWKQILIYKKHNYDFIWWHDFSFSSPVIIFL